jgi:hypothetical protein
MRAFLNAGARVRVTGRNHMAGYQLGDTGTVLRVSTLVTTGAPCYTVSMDKDGPAAGCAVFTEGEIEAAPDG